MTSTERKDVPAVRRRGLRDFLNTLFDFLEREQIRYCVLHSWEDLPGLLETGRDLDLAVDPRDAVRLQAVLRALSQAGYTPIQALNYEVNACSHVFGWFDGAKVMTVAVDFAFEHRARSLTWKSGCDLVSGRERSGNLWTASAATEFRYLLLKKSAKGSVREARVRRLCLLIGDLGQHRAAEIAGEAFGRKNGRDIVEACLDGRFEQILPGLWRVLRRRRLMLRPWNALGCVAQDGLRRVRRWLSPTGMCIILLGPDGVGKSTLIAGLREAFEPAFRRQQQYHWRPGLAVPIRDGDDSVDSPHAQPARSPLVSVCFLLGFFADFCLGYALRVRPLLARSGLIVFDRYFPDLMVDRKRYRYSGPAWLVKALWAILRGGDDLVIVLSADEHAILARKQQLPLDELRRQLVQYRKLAAEMPNAFVVETDDGIESTLSAGAAIVMRHLARRFEVRNTFMQGQTSAPAEGRP